MQSQYYGFTEGEKMQRILLKLSGEALAGEKKHGFDEDTVRAVALQVKQLVDDGITTKVASIGEESQLKLQDTMQKIVNDSNGGLVCIII